MVTKVKIDGMVRELDLSPLRYRGELREDDEVVMINPDTGDLCIASVSFDVFKRLWVKDTARVPAPFRWCLHKKRIYTGIYVINKGEI